MISAVYVDGVSKKHFVKRFLLETTTADKEFGFISEGIGSRLEFVTTSETPELEIEVVKGKGKDKETEVVNLEDLIDVKGWKALGNRLSQYKITKVRPVLDAEDTIVEVEDEVEEPEEIQSSKKKIEPEPVIEEDGQAALFGEAKPKAGPLVNGQPPKAKAPQPKEPKQANLFGENQKKEEVKNKSEAEGEKEVESGKLKGEGEGEGEKPDEKLFTAGDTIDLEL